MLQKINHFIREMFPLRVIKTSLSVFLAATLAGVLGFDSTFFAGLGAVKSMGFSIQESFETMKNQIIANAAAVLVSIIIAFTIGLSPFSAGIGIFIVINLLNYFKLKGTYVMAGITLCSMILVSDTTMTVLQRSYDRFTLMTIGLLVSFLVNIFIFRPNYQMKVDEYLQSLVKKTNQFFDIAQTGTLNQNLLQNIKSEYQLLKRYVFAAKSDESIAERFRYEHVQQLSALELYLIETDIKIKLIERLSQLDWIETDVYQQLQQLFEIELLVETELSQALIVQEIDTIQKQQFQKTYAKLFNYFQGYIEFENIQAHDAIRVLDLISMYVVKTEQLFAMLEKNEGV
ncbi:MAG: FUSC family protein [Culicoidibacterales bacterium]